jgi:hypothetical protein
LDTSFQAEDVIGTGCGALISSMFGAGWLGWGLGTAKAYNGFTAPTFGFTALFLFACSIYFIRKGRHLRKKSAATVDPARRTVRKWFVIIVMIEALAIVLVTVLATSLHRPDLATNWCAMVVGIHFLPLAKIFRAPELIVRGVLMTLWCAFCWVFFRSNALVISTSIGTGILLWGGSIFTLLRAWRIARAL